MNLYYISGFFDADGSITLSKQKKDSLYRSSLKIDFTNTQLQILQVIQKYLSENYNLKGYIITKKVLKNNHSQSYCLTYSNKYAQNLCKILSSIHPKKLHRINVVNKYYKQVTPRNGKYNCKQHQSKLAFERLFYWL